MNPKIIRVLKAIILAPLALAVFVWLAFLCFGGPIFIHEMKQPYQTYLWIATGVTLWIALGFLIYDSSERR